VRPSELLGGGVGAAVPEAAVDEDRVGVPERCQAGRAARSNFSGGDGRIALRCAEAAINDLLGEVTLAWQAQLF